MRKWILVLLSVMLLLFSVNALAETAMSFDAISATANFPDDYIYLNATNLEFHQDWLTANGLDQETVLADFEARGVLVQFWSPENDVCIEVSAVQDEDAAKYFDVDQQTTAARAAYRKSQSSGEANKAMGYAIQNAEWKRYTNSGRFLMMQYKRTVNTTVTYGYLRRTVRNGWHITVDYQVFGRNLNKSKDLTRLNAIMNSWAFTASAAIPATAVGTLEFTSEPPAETNTGAFTVTGKCSAGLELVGTLMRMADPSPIHVTTVANKNGEFKLDVQLPTEGWWLMTVTVSNGSDEVAEKIFDLTNYDKALLPVNLDTPIPEALTSDELIISGKTTKNVSIQCIVTTPYSTYDKTVKTNGKGTFSFKVPTAREADYSVTMIFQRKGYNTRRFTYAATRTLTEEDHRNQIKSNVVKPAYSTLVSKLSGYTGKNMVYRIAVTDIQQSGEEWIIFASMADKNTNKPLSKQKIILLSDEEPNLKVGDVVRVYGTLTGTYQIQTEDSISSLPCFDFLFCEPI